MKWAGMVIGLLLATAAAANTLPAPSVAAKLSGRDRTLIAAAACTGSGASGASQIEATAATGNSPSQVFVRCEPHRMEEGLPVAHQTNCQREKSAWRCDAGDDALLMTLQDFTVTALVPRGGLGARAALAAATEMARLSVPPFHGPAYPLMKGTCTLHQAQKAEFTGAAHFSLDCTGASLSMTRHCAKNRCRYFIIKGGEK